MSFRKRKRKIRKGLTLLDTSEITTNPSSTSLSSLASMSVDDISSMRDDQELDIELSAVAKNMRKKVLRHKERAGKEIKFNHDGEEVITFVDLAHVGGLGLLLNEKTLIYILYSALNICGSQIQLSDLMRFTREGQISLYSFLKHIPEDHRERLSLLKGIMI